MFSSLSHEHEFSVDIWFCYGSFFYGLESHINSLEDTKLSLTIHNSDWEESQEIKKFLTLIEDKPKGLLRVELRIYIPEKLNKKLKISSPLYLFTDVIPHILDISNISPILICSSIQGISPSNSENWMKLVRQISMQNEQNNFKKR